MLGFAVLVYSVFVYSCCLSVLKVFFKLQHRRFHAKLMAKSLVLLNCALYYDDKRGVLLLNKMLMVFWILFTNKGGMFVSPGIDHFK